MHYTDESPHGITSLVNKIALELEDEEDTHQADEVSH
jgi:hypothetical protein